MKTLIFAPAADIPRSSQNARPRRGCGGDSGDNPGRKSGRFPKTSGSGLHRQTDIRICPINNRQGIVIDGEGSKVICKG